MKAFIVLAAVAPLTGCSSPTGDAAGPAPGEGKAVVRHGTFRRHAVLTGELRAVRTVDITVPRTPQWSVRIRWMEVDGSTVALGQKVVEFDNSGVAANLEERRLAARRAADELERQEARSAAEVAEEEHALEKTRIGLKKAQIDADVPEALMPSRDWQERQLAERRARVAFEKARDELASTRRACQADIAVARIALEKARREVAVAEQAIASLAVAAPCAGILQIADHPWEGRKLQVNDTVWVGLPVMRIPDLSQMQVEAVLFDVDDGLVVPGAPARCTADTYPEEALVGSVVGVTPMAQELRRGSLRRAFRVTIGLAHSDPQRFRPGMSMRAEVEACRRDGVLIAPRSGLEVHGDAALAVLDGGRRVPVRLGPCSAQECVVEEGLVDGTLLGLAGGPA